MVAEKLEPGAPSSSNTRAKTSVKSGKMHPDAEAASAPTKVNNISVRVANEKSFEKGTTFFFSAGTAVADMTVVMKIVKLGRSVRTTRQPSAVRASKAQYPLTTQYRLLAIKRTQGGTRNSF